MSEVVEPRTTADIVRDLLAVVEEHEWVYHETRYGLGVNTCPECDADEGEHGKEGYRVHEPGCRRAAIILEARTFLEVEQELADAAEAQ